MYVSGEGLAGLSLDLGSDPGVCRSVKGGSQARSEDGVCLLIVRLEIEDELG